MPMIELVRSTDSGESVSTLDVPGSPGELRIIGTLPHRARIRPKTANDARAIIQTMLEFLKECETKGDKS